MPERDDQSPYLEGDPAFLLEEGVGYVRAWARAQHAVSALEQAFAELGHHDAMPYLRADVNVFGNGVVEVGRITPGTAALIAQALHLVKNQQGQRSGEAAA